MRWAIVAHCDDELIFAGGAILSHRDEPWTVVVASQPQDASRVAESLAARDLLRAMGLDIDYRFLGHDELQFHSTGGIDPPGLVRQLSGLGVQRGERVYTHGAPGEYGHNGHKAVHWSVAEALGRTAVVSAFSGAGEIVERITDPSLLAGKARLFNAAYPSQVGVWTGLAHTMIQVTSEERHCALSVLDAAAGETTNPLRPHRPGPPGEPDRGALTLAVNAQLGRLPDGLGDGLVIGLGRGVELEAVRSRLSGRIDLVGPFDEGTPEVADDPGLEVVAGDFAAWEPGDRRYDLIVCVGVMQQVRDFDAMFRKAAELLRPAGQLIFSHEPLIEGHPDYGRGYFMDEAPHYRRPTQTVLDLSRKTGLKLRLVRDLVAGRRTDGPVVCQLVRLERR